MPRDLSRKGCATCKARKIKCDERLPDCGQCMRAKRKCPGAITELIVINATAHTQDGCPKLTEGKIFAEQRTAGSKEVNRHGLSSAGNATPRSQRSSGDIMKDRVDIPRDGLGLTTEIFSAKCSQAQLLALFIEGFSNLHVDPSQPKPWYIELPYQSCPPELETLFRYTTSSSTLAFFGMITMDQAVQEEARRSYGLGLAYLRRELLQAQHKAKSWDEDKRFDYLRVLCSASMLLCGYELLQPSDTNTWFSHCMGSASLMEAIGSEACQEGFMHQVFHIVRFGVVLTLFVTPKSTFLSSNEWREVPFNKVGKTPYDDLVNILLAIPWTEIEPNTTASDFTSLRKQISTIECAITALDKWWKQHRNQYDIDYCPPRDYDDYGPCSQDVYRIGAVIVTLYHGSLAKLLGILRMISLKHFEYGEKFWQHAERVLSAASYVAERPNFHAKLQVLSPTTVVALYGPTATQRARAQQLLEQFTDDNKKGDAWMAHQAACLIKP